MGRLDGFNSRTATPEQLDQYRRRLYWIPPAAEAITREVDGLTLDAVVYRWMQDMRQRQTIRIVAFGGRRTKADINEYTHRADSAGRRIDDYFAGIAASAAYRAERRAAHRTVDMSPYQVGAILHYSFGYDMTINHYYQIVKVKGQSVVIRQISAAVVYGDGGYSGREEPQRDAFLSDEPEQTRRVTANGVKVGHRHAHIWSGDPNYFNYLD